MSIKTFLRSYGIIGPTEALISFSIFFTVLTSGGWIWGDRLVPTDPLYRQAAGAFLAGIIFSQIGNVMACRTNRQSAFGYLTKLNSWIAAGIVVEIVLIFTIIYVPLFNNFFSTHALDYRVWPMILMAPFIIFIVEEIRKLLARKGVNALSA